MLGRLVHLWLLVLPNCLSIRFHIDGRVQAPTEVCTRGPQAETQAEVLMGGPQHERGSHLSLKWQEEQLFVGSPRPLLAHYHSESESGVGPLR